MIGLDTNILARYYVDDKDDSEAQKQPMAWILRMLCIMLTTKTAMQWLRLMIVNLRGELRNLDWLRV